MLGYFCSQMVGSACWVILLGYFEYFYPGAGSFLKLGYIFFYLTESVTASFSSEWNTRRRSKDRSSPANSSPSPIRFQRHTGTIISTVKKWLQRTVEYTSIKMLLLNVHFFQKNLLNEIKYTKYCQICCIHPNTFNLFYILSMGVLA